ncbi:hypothetical protein [Treponema zioleckii]|uniref:RipA family octameric membrane protein n=1 Tax=Treponema zioleckii TaxID=331680 RepID=UPI00168ACDBC|nr:hypothetical protein [Treponema zioleckii]
MKYFSDSEYEENQIEEMDTLEGTKKGIKAAYKKACECRDFEIDLFWKRGTYFWAFILASFTAHFALFSLVFSNSEEKSANEISLKVICNLPGLALFGLAVTAFFCFFFSYLWVLVQKGSKFWQTNWERHIDNLEEYVTGKLFDCIMNGKNPKKCSPNPLSFKPYRYSVSRISQLSAIVLMVTSGSIFLFYIFLIFAKSLKIHELYEKIPNTLKNLLCKNNLYAATSILLLTACILVIVCTTKHLVKTQKHKIGDKKADWYIP